MHMQNMFIASSGPGTCWPVRQRKYSAAPPEAPNKPAGRILEWTYRVLDLRSPAGSSRWLLVGAVSGKAATGE